MALRGDDFARSMPRIQNELIITGVIAFALCVLVATPIFFSAVRNVQVRTQAVMLLLLHVPRRLAKALKDRAQTSFDRMVAQSEKDTEGSRDRADRGHGGFEDEEAEKRLFVQEDEKEEIYRTILRAARRQVQKRIESHKAAAIARKVGPKAATGHLSIMDPNAADETSPNRIIPKEAPMQTDDELDEELGISEKELAGERQRNNTRWGEGDASGPAGATASYLGHSANEMMIPPPSRPYASSSGFVCQQVTLFMSPVMLVMGFLLFSVFYLRSRLVQADRVADRLLVIGQAAIHASRLIHNAAETAMGEPGSDYQRDFFIETVNEDINLAHQTYLMQYGGLLVSE